ncbi:MAG: histidinol-phosphate transaminase [Ignavibacteriaceae bacterium]
MDIKSLVRKNIINLKPYTSARDIYDSSEGILLDANENSFGSTFIEFNGLKLNRYPDPHQKEIRKATSDYYSIPFENIFFGVGSDEVIDLLVRVFCNPGQDNAIIPEPTYGMYKVACDINNVEAKEVLLNDDFQIDLKAIAEKVNDHTKIIFLCSPNNPTGNVLDKNDILNLCSELNSIVVVDEAYIDFSIKDTIVDEIKNQKNLIVLRTFSKAWGLAGIRSGFCAADEEIINILFKVKAPYNINALSRYALIKAVENSSRKDAYVNSILKEKERLKNQLETLVIAKNVYNSNANFLLVKFENAKIVQDKLLGKGIIVRDRSTQPKLENCLRITIGNEEENDLLWEELIKIK